MKPIDWLEPVSYEDLGALFPDALECEITSPQLNYGVDCDGVLWCWIQGSGKEALWQWHPAKKEWGTMFTPELALERVWVDQAQG